MKLKIFDELNFERIREQNSDLSLPSKSTSKYFELGQFEIGFWLKEGDTYYWEMVWSAESPDLLFTPYLAFLFHRKLYTATFVLQTLHSMP